MVFVHGWPELSLSWRHQLRTLGARGFHCVAPDMRGYGRSSVYTKHGDYAQEQVVGDMLALHDHLGTRRAVWVGHDWGSPTVWALGLHHPQRCAGIVSLCVPHGPLLLTAFNELLTLVDRDIYPVEQFPAGQWEYQVFYQEDFGRAVEVFEADVANSVRVMFRKGNPAHRGKPSATAFARRNRGFFGPRDAAPDFALDEDILSEAEAAVYIEALGRNGFFGPCSYYMNHAANFAYARSAPGGGQLRMPVLFLHARYDTTCETVNSRLADLMRELCENLTEATVDSGHWMAQERPAAVNRHLVHWLANKVPHAWQ